MENTMAERAPDVRIASFGAAPLAGGLGITLFMYGKDFFFGGPSARC